MTTLTTPVRPALNLPMLDLLLDHVTADYARAFRAATLGEQGYAARLAASADLTLRHLTAEVRALPAGTARDRLTERCAFLVTTRPLIAA